MFSNSLHYFWASLPGENTSICSQCTCLGSSGGRQACHATQGAKASTAIFSAFSGVYAGKSIENVYNVEPLVPLCGNSA